VSVHAYLERLMENEVAGIAQTEALLQEAAESGDYIELTDQEWDRIEEEALARPAVIWLPPPQPAGGLASPGSNL
jgi:hypothetical protein